MEALATSSNDDSAGSIDVANLVWAGRVGLAAESGKRERKSLWTLA